VFRAPSGYSAGVRVVGRTLVFLLLAAVAFYFLTLAGAGVGYLLQQVGLGLSDQVVNVVAWTCGGVAAIAVLVIGVRMRRE
jgi:hypothetical protein